MKVGEEYRKWEILKFGISGLRFRVSGLGFRGVSAEEVQHLGTQISTNNGKAAWKRQLHIQWKLGL